MRNFESIRRHLTTASFNVTSHDDEVVCIELSLEQGTRHQAIFLSELDDDDGRPYLRVSTAVAPTTGLDAAEVDRLVLEIGGLGDRMERMMSAGGDLL